MSERSDHQQMYPPEKLKEFQQMLEKRRGEILKDLDAQRTERETFKSAAEPDAYDDASNQVEINIRMALSDAQKQELSQIDIALSKIEEGTYGVCEGCGQLISEARLRALPFATLCVECKSKQERGTVIVRREPRVPVDEELLLTDEEEEE